MRGKALLAASALVIPVAALVVLHYSSLDGIPGLLWSLGMREDTAYAPGYSDGAFRNVRFGMTEQEVLTLLGPPLRKRTDAYALHNTSGCTECWSYSESPGDTHYRIRLVCFRDGSVRAWKAEYWVD